MKLKNKWKIFAVQNHFTDINNPLDFFQALMEEPSAMDGLLEVGGGAVWEPFEFETPQAMANMVWKMAVTAQQCEEGAE
jgi:hypothetical protein